VSSVLILMNVKIGTYIRIVSKTLNVSIRLEDTIVHVGQVLKVTLTLVVPTLMNVQIVPKMNVLKTLFVTIMEVVTIVIVHKASTGMESK
jgi:hypothetical protein